MDTFLAKLLTDKAPIFCPDVFCRERRIFLALWRPITTSLNWKYDKKVFKRLLEGRRNPLKEQGKSLELFVFLSMTLLLFDLVLHKIFTFLQLQKELYWKGVVTLVSLLKITIKFIHELSNIFRCFVRLWLCLFQICSIFLQVPVFGQS